MSGEAKNKKHYGKGKGGKGAMKGLEKEENKTNGVTNGEQASWMRLQRSKKSFPMLDQFKSSRL